jgi:hypothetical protein
VPVLAAHRVGALVTRADGTRLRLDIQLAINGSSVTGAMAAEPDA